MVLLRNLSGLCEWYEREPAPSMKPSSANKTLGDQSRRGGTCSDGALGSLQVDIRAFLLLDPNLSRTALWPAEPCVPRPPLRTIAAQSAKQPPHLHPSVPSSTSPPLSSPSLLRLRLSWPCNTQLSAVIECIIHWLLFKGELRWCANRLPRVQPVFIYRGSKHWNSWPVQKVVPLPICLAVCSVGRVFRSRRSPLLFLRRHRHWQPFISVPVHF